MDQKTQKICVLSEGLWNLTFDISH